MVGYLHTTIGTTTPAPDKVWMVALIWVASAILPVDGLLLLLVVLTSHFRLSASPASRERL